MRKVIIILLLFTCFRTLVSCCKELGFNFRWSKATVSNLNISSNPTVPLLVDSSKIDNYGFQLKFDYEQVGYNFINQLGLNETYALSCLYVNLNKDSVISIDVITVNDIDNSHPAGSSITDYLLARPGLLFVGTNNQYGPVSAMLDHVNNNTPYSFDTIDFKFKNITLFIGLHTFVVNVKFKSGRTLSGSTSIKFFK